MMYYIILGAKGILTFDINHIVLTMPYGLRDRYELCCLLALGISVGYRGVCILSLTWSNIRLILSGEGGYRQLQLKFLKTKGLFFGSIVLCVQFLSRV